MVGQTVAHVLQRPDGPPDLYVDNLGVAPTHRRRGVAGRLLDEAFQWGRAQAWIVTETDNVAAKSLYRARGSAD